MTVKEAKEWLKEERSHWNEIHSDLPLGAGRITACLAVDALMSISAYFRLKAEAEGLMSLPEGEGEVVA